jgi:hypothetical protein
MSNTGLTKYYEADEWTKMMVKGKYLLRESFFFIFFISYLTIINNKYCFFYLFLLSGIQAAIFLTIRKK